MKPDVSESSNLLTHVIEYDYNEEHDDENSIIEEDDDFDIKPVPSFKEKQEKKKRCGGMCYCCCCCFFILLLIGTGVAFIFFSTKKFKINEFTDSNAGAKYSFKFEKNQIIEGEYDQTLAVQCENGIFVGKKYGEIITFKGIPYAQPPTGSLRWKPPVKMEVNSENIPVYQAFHFGYSPIQTQWASEAASYYEQSEDCLTLNIWMANFSEELRPVIVFIYGGSYGWGGSVDPLYDGINFVKKNPDVIFVSINYRVGIMGFIDFSKVKGGEEYQKSGNLGILDQIQALRWIKNNIAEFGGDPNNITVLGESAGAGSVSLLSIIPQAKGLFNRVIVQSGSIALTYSKKECEKLTKLLLEEANADTMEDLLTLNEETLKEINIKLNDYSNFPERDGIIIPEDLYEAYYNGSSKNIDMLIGTNHDESRYWIRAFGNEYVSQMAIPILYENNMKEVSDDDKNKAERFVRLQESSYPWSISEFYNELLFRLPAMEQAIGHSKNEGNAYMYYWADKTSYKSVSANHGVELSVVLNNLNSTVYEEHLINKHLVDMVQTMWVNFAKTGNPSVGNMTWEKFDPAKKNVIMLGDDIHMEDKLYEEHYVLLKPLLKYKFNGSYTDLDYNVNYVQKVIIGIVCILIALFILPLLICIRRK